MSQRREKKPAGRKPAPRKPRHAISLSPFENHMQAQRFELLIRAIEHLLKGYKKFEVSTEARGLSEALSRSRGSTVRQEYLSEELTQAAYCAHFLPWNIYRLLFAWRSFAPRVEPVKPGETLRIADWGAGPMTGLIALWVKYGEKALADVVYSAIEKQGDILRWGMRICRSLGLDKKLQIESRNELLDLDDEATSTADLLLVANAFNEWLPPRGRSDESIRAFARLVNESLSEHGQLSLMEPASRVVGWGVMTLRDVFIERGLNVQAPCTHHERCPLLNQRLKTWCHFRIPIEVHEYHKPLADAIRIDRETISYSYLAVTRADREAQPKQRSVARVLSDPIQLSSGSKGVYACAPSGRVLIEASRTNWNADLREKLSQDQACVFKFPKQIKKDAKSKAPRIPAELARTVEDAPLVERPSRSDP